MRPRDAGHRAEPITRGPLRLERPTWEPPEPPVRTVEEEIVRALQASGSVE